MAMLAKAILQELGRQIYPRKQATLKEIRMSFAKHGYGPAKTTRWQQYLLENEILTEHGRGVDDVMLFDCIWW